MRAAMVVAGGPKVPDLAKAHRHGITRLYFEARDPQVDAALLDALRAQHFEVGIVRDPTWDGLGAVDLAHKLSDDLVRLGSTAKQCAVLADIELHDPKYVWTWLAVWRSPDGADRPTRVTAWTLEPFQGGWFSPALQRAIAIDPNLQVLPQFYLGTPRMYPAAADVAVLDLINHGVTASRVQGFYDGERELPDRWNGIVFNFAALP